MASNSALVRRLVATCSQAFAAPPGQQRVLASLPDASCSNSLAVSPPTGRGQQRRALSGVAVSQPADNNQGQRATGRHLSLARSCSSCNVLRQELPFNRLPGSAAGAKSAAAAAAASSSREDQGAAGADDRRRAGAAAPRVTLFKDARPAPGAWARRAGAELHDWRLPPAAANGGKPRERRHNQAPLGDINRAGALANRRLASSWPRPSDGSSCESGQSWRAASPPSSARLLSDGALKLPPPRQQQQQQRAGGSGGGDIEGARRPGALSESSKRLLASSEDYARILWRAARNYQQTDHYDHSLFGLDVHLDQAVARHQREAMLYNQDRHLKEEQAKQVAPNLKQSPVAIMSVNPAYELLNKPLILDYPATVENLRLNNTGFSWEVKIPYQISMTTALHGAHLNQTHRFRLDQFHCHWGEQSAGQGGSEHTVDSRSYSAELHFVHYNMEKYHTLAKAARHADGLVVLSVFVDAQPHHHNHAELDKIVANLKSIALKGEHTIIRQAVRIENLLPANRSYWSYQGSLTTPPFLESVTWFVLKQPIRCNTAQVEKFKSLSSCVRRDDEPVYIRSNHRKTQPLNGRTIVMYDEPASGQAAGPRNL